MKKTLGNSKKRMRRTTGAEDVFSRLLAEPRPLPEVPPALDAAVLAAAGARLRDARRETAEHLRFSGRFPWRGFRIAGAAAAFAVLAGGVFLLAAREHRETEKQRTELLSLWDFSTLEQNNYNLNFELDSRQNDPYAGLAMR